MAENEEMAENVDIDVDDLGQLRVCAIRYCMSRDTSFSSQIREIAKKHLGVLSNFYLVVLMKDFKVMKEFNYWDDDPAKKEFWTEWENQLYAEGWLRILRNDLPELQ